MPLTCDEKSISSPHPPQSYSDSLSSIRNSSVVLIPPSTLFLDSLFNGNNNLLGVLAARIIRGNDRIVGKLQADLPHKRTLSRISVSTTSEYHPEFASRQLAKAPQNFLQSIRSVSIINKNIQIFFVLDILQSTRDPLYCLQSFLNDRRRHLFSASHRDSCQSIVDIVTTQEGEINPYRFILANLSQKR